MYNLGMVISDNDSPKFTIIIKNHCLRLLTMLGSLLVVKNKSEYSTGNNKFCPGSLEKKSLGYLPLSDGQEVDKAGYLHFQF